LNVFSNKVIYTWKR